MKKNLFKTALLALAVMAAGETYAQTVTVASWDKAVIDGGTWTSIGNAFWLDASKDNAQVTQKYNSNKTSVNVLTFTSSISYSNGEFNNAIKLEGDFKDGDIVTLQPFTNMSTADFTGSGNADGIPTKYANIVIKDASNTELYTTGGTAVDKTVTDGHEEAGDPKEFTYTLTADQSVLYFGRTGNTRINVIKIVVERPQSTATVNVTDALYATFGNNTGVTMGVPEGLTAYGVSSVSEGVVNFTEYNVIPNGVGVVLKAAEAGEYTLSRTDEACTYTDNNYMVAVTEDKTVPVREGLMLNYIFANKEQGVGFYKSSGTGEIAAGKAYLSIEDTEVDSRSWNFTSFSDATKADLETELQMAEGSDATTAGTAVAGELWIMGAEKSGAYRYKNVGALSGAELVANGNVIAETAGLLFTAKDGKLGIDCRSSVTQVFLDGTASTITIPNLKAGHTVTITARTSSSGAAAYMTCTDNNEDHVTRTGDTESTVSVDNVFTILASGTYTFAPSRSINVTKITIAPKEEAAGAKAYAFIGFGPDNTPTGISDAARLNSKGENTDLQVYDLQGRRVGSADANASLKKGLYIMNGKKVIVK